MKLFAKLGMPERRVMKGGLVPLRLSRPAVVSDHPPREYDEPPDMVVPPRVTLEGIIDKTLTECSRDRVDPYEALPRPAKKRKKHVVHPSQAQGCPRALAFNLLDPEEEVEEADPKMMRIWGVGHQGHRRIQGYLWEACLRQVGNVTRFWEDVQLAFAALAVYGELDAIIEIGGRYRYVVEVKTAGRKKFDALREPLDAWIWQSYLYMAATGIRAAIVVVECKDSQRIQDFYVPWEDEVWAEIEDSILKVLETVRKRKLPPPDTGYCHWCEYKDWCDAKGGDPKRVPWVHIDKIPWDEMEAA
jgi:CRISPR/Cas system-associated exonuclease Cas4 (RecB family)